MPQRSKPSSFAFETIHSVSPAPYITQFCRNLRFSERRIAFHMQKACQPSAAELSALRFWLLTPMAATMLGDGRLASNSGPHSQGEGKRRRTGEACRTLRAHPRRYGGIRTG